MRVYALYYRNKWVLCVVVLEAAAAISVACVSSVLYNLNICMFISVVDSHPIITRRGHFRESDTVSSLLSGHTVAPSFRAITIDVRSQTDVISAYRKHTSHGVVKRLHPPSRQGNLWPWPFPVSWSSISPSSSSQWLARSVCGTVESHFSIGCLSTVRP